MLVAGNWKMNGLLYDAEHLAEKLASGNIKNRNTEVTKTQYKVQKKYCEVKELISNFLSIKKLINKNIKIEVDTHGSGIPKILNASNALNRKPTKRIEYIIFLFFKIN